MRHSRPRLFLSLLFFLLLFCPPAQERLFAAGASKLSAHLQVMSGADREKLRAMSAFLGIDAEAPNPTAEVLIKVNPGAKKSDLERLYPNSRFHSQVGGIITAVVPINELYLFENDPGIVKVEHSHKSKPTMDAAKSTAMSGGLFLGVLENAGDLSSAFGAGVVVGVIDTGIDYTHADFNATGGQPFMGAPYNTRLLNIWDQLTAGTPPGGFAYGNECPPAQINAGTCSEQDTNGHGTNVIGIAAGNGRATKDNGVPAFKYTGIASQASLIMVKSDFTDAHVIDAMNYIVAKAQAMGKRAVINMSFGGQSSGHDGTDNLETAISAVAASTPIAVAMGNDNQDSPHANFSVPAGGVRSPTVNTVTTSGNGNYKVPGGGFIDTEFWYPAGDDYALTVTTGSTNSVSFGVGVNGTLTLATNVTVQVVHGSNSLGDKQIFVEVQDTRGTKDLVSVTYQLTRSVSGGSGNVDGYTQPSILGTSFASFVSGSGTLTRPATADNVFAVAAYNTKKTWPVDPSSPSDPVGTCGSTTVTYNPPVPLLGQIANFSGLGPRRNGASNTLSTGNNGAKPDIAAPGQGIASSLSANSSPTTCFVVDDGVHFIDQGTSQATPVLSGVIAVMLGVNPGLTVPQIRSALQTTARSDGGEGSLPNDIWGPGKIVGAPTKVRLAPSAVSSTVMGTSSITFSWSLGAPATSYNLYDAYSPFSFQGANIPNSQTLLGLSPNTLYGRQVRGVNGYGEGPGATIFTAATLANQPVPSLIQAFLSSITVTFAAGAGGANGFSLFGTTVADTYGGTLFSSTTSNGASTQLTLTGLASATNYCLRLASLNQASVQNPALIGCAMTQSPFVAPPIVVPPSGYAQTQIQLNWTQGSNPPSVNYSADASTDPTPAFYPVVANVQGIDIFSALFTGLSVNTSYYFRVRANTGPYSSTGPYATLAGLPAPTAPAFGVISAASIVANWGYGPDPPGTLFLVQASTDPTPAFYPVAASSQTVNPFGSLSGLNPNTTYFARVQAISRGSVPTGFTALGSTSTLGAPPLPTVFTNQTVTGFTASYTNGGNGPGTIFVAQVSADPTAAFSPVASSSQTLNTFATFSGLVPNQQYFFRAGAINNDGGVNFNAFAQEISTFTAPVAPASAAPVAGNQTVSAIRFFWSPGPNAAGTTYTARACSDPLCSGILQTVPGIGATFQDFNVGLAANTTYYLQVQALHQGASNPDSSFVLLGASATLANAPPGATTVLPVTFSSFTVTWPVQPACEGYRVQAALDPAFTMGLQSQDLPGFATNTAGLIGLLPGTTYYVRVGSLNWNSVPDYSVVASTMTLVPIQSTGTVAPGGLTLSVVPAAAAVTSLRLVIPPSVLPTGTLVTINTSVAYQLPPPISNEAKLTPLAPGLGFSIDASGLQPAGGVDLLVKFDPLQFPPGFAARSLQLARYDPVAGQWTLLPTSVDPSQNTAVGHLNHFSLFAPFLVAAAGDLSQINIFPTPWEPLSPNTLLNAPVLTFTNLPGGASVRVMSLTGALMWSAAAAANGVLTWDGSNRFGRTLGSGTYLAIIESQGKTTVKRLVIVR